MATKRKGGYHQQRTSAVVRPVESNRTILGLLAAAVIVLAIVPYLPALGYGFVNFDDGTYVAENPVVRQGLTWSNINWAWTTMTAGNWHPVTWMSHMIDCQLFGLHPGWHHFENVLLHAANSGLIFFILYSMTRLMWRSVLVAALFAVHPLHVESVAWIAERKDVLSTLFGLLSIGAYVRYVRSPSFSKYAAVAGFFALSLLSKPMLVTLPFALLLLDVWPLRRAAIGIGQGSQSRHRKQGSMKDQKISSLLLEKLPLLAMSAVSSLLTFKAQHMGGAVAPIDVLPMSQRVANAAVAYVTYLGKTFWPSDLAVIYPLPVQIAPAKVLGAIVLLVATTVGLVVFMRNRPWLLIGWLWFLGML